MVDFGSTPISGGNLIGYQLQTADGEGLSSQEWFNNEDYLATWGGKLISTFDKNKTYTYKLYLTMAPQTSDTSPDYKITEGANGTWTQNSGGMLRFAANGDLSKFTGVQVDGKLLTADQYTAASGSTVVTLKASYLTTLSAGKHTLTVVYTDGDCSTEFEIQSAGNTDPGNNDKPGNNTDPGSNTDSPETGDNSSIVLWLSLLFVGGVLAGVPVVLRKEREHR